MIKICLSNYNSSIFQCCGNYLPWRRTSVILDVICLILLWICLTLTNTSVKFWSIKFWALWVFQYQFQLQEMSDYWTFTILAFRYQVIRLWVLGQFLYLNMYCCQITGQVLGCFFRFYSKSFSKTLPMNWDFRNQLAVLPTVPILQYIRHW